MFLVGSRLVQKFTNLLDTFSSYVGKAGQYIRIKSTEDELEATIPSIPIATAGGTVDAITADYTPDVTLANLTLVAFVAIGANTSTTPTFAPDGLTARTITKKGGVALLAGDIAGAGFVAILEYNLANIRWELLNPATAVELTGDQTVAGIKTFSSQVLLPNGSTSAPAIAFTNDTDTGFIWTTSGPAIYWVVGGITRFILSAADFSPNSAGTALSGNGSTSYWDVIYSDDFINIADWYFFDDKDDLIALENIKPSGKKDIFGRMLIDDNTLPDYILAKYKEDKGEHKKGDIIRTAEGNKPSISLKAAISFCMGTTRQLSAKNKLLEKRIDDLEKRIEK